ncbi:MAG: (5-formylfuran-3-yl)methyl phosphate synthase [Candidatus Lokiarchaeota archaeon]
MKLLVSPKNLKEAKICVSSKVDYIDCKNPKEGSLGANFPWIISAMKKLIPLQNNQLLSATIGDFPHLPGSASLAALGASVSGADIVKVGLKGPCTLEEAVELMKSVVKAVRDFNRRIKIVAAGYADYERMENAPSFLQIPTIVSKSGADIAMLDTFIKDGKGLFDFLGMSELTDFIQKAKSYGIGTALAGSLKISDLKNIKKLSPDIIGIRSAVCEDFDRLKGEIKSDLIDKFRKELLN